MNIKKYNRQPTQTGGERQPTSNSFPPCPTCPFVQQQLRLDVPVLVFPHGSLSKSTHNIS